MPRLAQHQFTRGGPIIMFQVENEYAGTGYGDHNYLWHLRQLMLDNGQSRHQRHHRHVAN